MKITALIHRVPVLGGKSRFLASLGMTTLGGINAWRERNTKVRSQEPKA